MIVNWGEIVHWVCTVFVAAITVSPVWLNMWMRTKALEKDMQSLKAAHEEAVLTRRDQAELDTALLAALPAASQTFPTRPVRPARWASASTRPS